uniref:Reverse transcriptase domain-containing protein n=1 Tax=Tanacetum cinerariifolium TaxID=118510 RepID=A0A6L2J620_TANCI|nr:reverse transcriptase domain-containing protein [Tanacetum cinerariifolium]
MTWVDFKALLRKELCPNNEIQKMETDFWCYVMVKAGHTAYTDRFHELARLVPYLVTSENKRTERKNNKKRGNGREPSRDRNVKDDNKRSKFRRVFSTTTNPIRKEYIVAREACFECGGIDHYKAACLRLNRAPRHGGNHPNQAMDIEGGQGRGNNGNPTRGREFVMGAEEAP